MPADAFASSPTQPPYLLPPLLCMLRRVVLTEPMLELVLEALDGDPDNVRAPHTGS